MKRNRSLVLGLGLGLVLAVLGGTAPVLDAATVTTTFPVTTTVVAACTVSATGVSFGPYSGTAITANGTVTVTCPAGSAFTIALNAGSNVDNVNLVRRMALAGNFIPYRLFREAGRTTEWGDNCAGGGGTYVLGNCQASIASGGPDQASVFGTALAGGSTLAGSYSDTVVVTIVF
jgi:spore coat protein U-like protein